MSMSDDLCRRINSLSPKQPYVWRLRISTAEFEMLQEAVQGEGTTNWENLVYLAEWYKRCYDGGTAKPVREFDAKELFEKCGIEKAGNLFQTENGNNTWLYSIYVLGGVAIPFELGKRDTKFLKELCRVYYGEEGDVDKLGEKDASRAIAFRESIKSKGSIYEFIRAIVKNGGETAAGGGTPALPFADEDLKDPDSQVNEFIARVRKANDEVLKSKFELEWVIGFEPDVEFMTRKVRLVMKPESLGGVNHQYLAYNRAEKWGITRPDKCKRFVIGVRFLHDGKIVAESDFAHPLLEYVPTGNRDVGFMSIYDERRSRKIDAPVERFDSVEIVAKDDQNAVHVVETFKVQEWMQVFRTPEAYNEWTSQNCSQRASALVCPEDYTILEDVGLAATIFRKRFWTKSGGESDVYQFRQIVDKVGFVSPSLKETTLYNRQGYDQIVAVPHHETLRYQDGMVTYIDESDGGYEESLLPLVFGREDLIVRHFESRNDMQDDDCSDYEYEKLEYREGGNFIEWTDTSAPKQGRTTLRITIKGVQRKFVVYFLPLTIGRNCNTGEIECGNETIHDEIVRNGTPLDPVIRKCFGTEDRHVDLEIWRATKHKEIIRGGRVVRYVEDGDVAEISYVLKDDLQIHDYSEGGYREYECRQINGIYKLKEFSPEDNGNTAALTSGAKVRVADELDASAPEWLWVNLAGCGGFIETALPMMHWDFTGEPETVGEDFQCGGNDVVFPDLRDAAVSCVWGLRLGRYNAFKFAPSRSKIDLVKCFDVATEYRVYYFAMLPLRLPNVDF